MPKELEMKLEKEAEKKGYTGKRKDKYVYGTLNKLGMLHSNRAGALGPDKLFSGGFFKVKKTDGYHPTFDKVPGIYIGVLVAILLLLYWYWSKMPMVMSSNSDYVDVQSAKGWMYYQYNSLGSNAGVLYGESN